MFVGHYGVSFAAKRGDKTIGVVIVVVLALVSHAAFAAVAGWLDRRRA